MSVKQSVLKFIFMVTICSLALIACQPTSTVQPGEDATPTAQTTEAASEASATPASAAGLLTIKDNQPAPGLATSWTVSEDGLDYVFQLKTGAMFDDGTPINADAVVANFNRWFDPNNPARGSGSYEAWATAFGGFKGEKDETGQPKSIFDGIEKVDSFTVLIHLNKPFSDLLTVLAQPDFVIVSPASFKTE
jgi:peptide/nickel transport system substrate-binding protein